MSSEVVNIVALCYLINCRGTARGCLTDWHQGGTRGAPTLHWSEWTQITSIAAQCCHMATIPFYKKMITSKLILMMKNKLNTLPIVFKYFFFRNFCLHMKQLQTIG